MVRRKVAITKKMFEQALNDEPIEADFGYWLDHAFHWCALLVAIISIIFIGRFVL